jgi:signal peptidase I
MTIRRAMSLAAAVALLAVCGTAVYAWSSGVRLYAVESGSMTPALSRGDLLVDLPTTATTTYRVGDVITFHPTPGYTTTHRIVAIDAAGISTKGDANPSADLGQIQPSSIIGQVAVVVPFGGYVAMFFRQPAGMAVLLLAIVALYLVWRPVADRRAAAPKSVDISPSPTPEWPQPSKGDPL